MIEFLLILIIGLGLWVLTLQINCTHLRVQLEQNRKLVLSLKKSVAVFAEAVGADVKAINQRLDKLEHD